MSRGGSTELLVAYENGEEVKVRAQQRDLALWERQPFGCPATQANARTPVLFFRFLGWASLWRSRQLPQRDGKALTWEQWDEIVDYVEPLGQDEDQDEDQVDGPGPDPTRPEPSPPA